MPLSLPWSNFFWPDFQVLVHHFAELHLPGVKLDEYLKQGNKQHGIDLIQRNTSVGRGIAIQCKRENVLTESDLEKLVQEFLDGDYRGFTTTFYLATSADLQSSKLNGWLEKKQRELQETYKIGFIWWDIYYLERHLKAYWSLVAKHFGKQIADDFCYKELRLVPFEQLKPTEDPIPRKVEPVTAVTTAEDAIWFVPGANGVDLAHVLTKDRLATKRLCLIAEAHQGKSTLLKQCAYGLAQAGLRIQPLFIDIKEQSVRPIDKLLAEKYGAWKNIPLKDILLFIDGTDEAPSARFLELIGYIKSFSRIYTDVSIIIACRGMFYQRYDLGTELRDFTLYQLSPFEPKVIEDYVKKRLGERRAELFVTEVNNLQLGSWLKDPFYLVQLVNRFDQIGALPESKLQVVEEFIEKNLEKDGGRKLNNGDKIALQLKHLRHAIEKLAICMQLMGKNSLSREEYLNFFNDKETELLQHCSMVSQYRRNWTFTDAFLQEHLAAIYLLHTSTEEIINLVTISPGIKKIRTKWIQTIHSLLSLLPPKAPLFRQLLQFMEEDSLELVFRTDAYLHTDDFKLNALQKLLTQIRQTGIWPQTIPFKGIAGFMREVPGTVGFLVDWLRNTDGSDSFKTVCCRILASIDADEEDAEEVFDVVRREITATTNARYAGELVVVLASWKLGTESHIRGIIAISPHNQAHPFRNSVYGWITSLELNEQFWPYGLEGVPILIAYNHPISQGGSEWEWERFVLTVHHRRQLYSLFGVMATEEWRRLYQYKGSHNEGFLSKLMQRCIQLYKEDPLVFLPVSNLIKVFAHRMPKVDTQAMQFVEDTQTHGLILQRLGPAMFSREAWGYGSLVTKRSIDYLIWLFEELPWVPEERPWLSEEGAHQLRDLQMPVMALSDKAPEIADAYREAVRGATEGKVFGLEDPAVYARMRDADEQRLQNDLSAIQDVESFRRAVKRFFSVVGKKSVDQRALYWDQTSKASIVCSPFITALLRDWIAADIHGKVALKDCLAFLDKEEQFEYFRAIEILDYRIETADTKRVFTPILQAYYAKYLPSCHFENSYRLEESLYYEKQVEILIGNLFDRYEFPTADKYLVEFIWLNRTGFGPEGQSPKQQAETLQGKILRHMGSQGEHLLTEAILSHLQTGIRHEAVLLNHLYLCRRLKIKKAKKLVLEVIQKRTVDPYSLHRVVDTYIGLGGKKENLLVILEQLPIRDVLFQDLLRNLMKNYPEKVAAKAKKALDHSGLPPDEGLKIAHLLTDMGQPEGFQYQVDLLQKGWRSMHHLQNGQALANLDTGIALAILWPLMYFCVDPAYTDLRGPDNPRHMVFDWIAGLAGKDETDLQQVLHFLQAEADRLQPMYSDVSELRWYQIRISEKFRNMQEKARTVADIRAFIQSAEEKRAHAVPSVTTPSTI